MLASMVVPTETGMAVGMVHCSTLILQFRRVTIEIVGESSYHAVGSVVKGMMYKYVSHNSIQNIVDCLPLVRGTHI